MDELAQTMAKLAETVTTFKEIWESFARVIKQAWDSLVAYFTKAGLMPPPAMAHGQQWSNWATGEQFRVAGRRGRPQTFHWTEARPRRSWRNR